MASNAFWGYVKIETILEILLLRPKDQSIAAIRVTGTMVVFLFVTLINKSLLS